MAAAIKEATGAEPELIESSGGVFDVIANGKQIYCKHDTGRFPTNEEVIQQLT